MSDAPIPPITVRIEIGGEDWAYVQNRLRHLHEMSECRDASSFRLCGGGGGGAYSCTTTTRDVTREQYRAELSAWFEARRAEPAEDDDGLTLGDVR